MQDFRLSIEDSGNMWFGCLVDDWDKLVASAFGPSAKSVQVHLLDYSKKFNGTMPVLSKHRLAHEMAQLFDGSDVSRRIKFNTDFISNFQREVYRVLERIPRGKVTTYGLISKHLDSGPRAVGGAVASNPWPLFMPCHRVVNANLTIGNYSMCGSLGRTGSVTKRSLLDREDVKIHGDQIEHAALWDPSGNLD